MSEFNFGGKTVLVIGGSSGIGNGIAQSFRQREANVFVWGTRASASDYTGSSGSVLEGLNYAQVDVSVAAQIEAYKPPFKNLDVLVQSQGTVEYGRREFEPDVFRRIIDVNLNSLMLCAVKFKPMLSASRGSMIIVNSVAAYRATMGNPAYSASKSGVLGLTRTLAQAWARDAVRVNGIAPGIVETKLTRVTVDHPDRRKATMESIPMGRLGELADMIGPVLFLASPLSAYMTGQTLIVDGGATL